MRGSGWTEGGGGVGGGWRWKIRRGAVGIEGGGREHMGGRGMININRVANQFYRPTTRSIKKKKKKKTRTKTINKEPGRQTTTK